jgi:hypothetical protein
MNLYEINSALLACVDDETGEILDSEAFTQLLKAKDEKIENCALWIKDINGDIEKVSKEIERLNSIKSALMNKAKNIREYVSMALGGEKYKTERISIYFTHPESVEITDEATIPDEYIKVIKEPMKTAIKEAIKAGKTVPGAALTKGTSMVIR